MIRRTTPSKSLLGQERASSCCRWFDPEQLDHQLRITLDKKAKPNRFSDRTSVACRRDEVPEGNGYQTPIKVHQVPRKVWDTGNEMTWGTARTMDEQRPQTFVTLPSSQEAKNPLQRLHRLHKKTSHAPVERLTIGLPATRSISFNYMTPRKQVNIREGLSTGVVTIAKPEQRQGQGQDGLRKEIQTFRREYQQLLREYNELRRRKQTNLSVYKSLLAQLKAKKEEIVALERLRREEMDELRVQIEQVIAERQHMDTSM